MFQKGINIIIFLFSSILFSQDLDKDLKIVLNQLNSSYLSLKVKVDVYSKKGANKIYASEASLQKNNSTTLRVLAEQEIFVDEGYIINIDHEEKLIYVAKQNLKSIETNKNGAIDKDVLIFLNDLFAESKDKKPYSIKLISSVSGKKKYSITNVPDIKEIIIELDLNNNKISSISYEYYNEKGEGGQFVFIAYTEFSTDVNKVGHLSRSKYINVNAKGKIDIVPQLKGYTLNISQ